MQAQFLIHKKEIVVKMWRTILEERRGKEDLSILGGSKAHKKKIKSESWPMLNYKDKKAVDKMRKKMKFIP